MWAHGSCPFFCVVRLDNNTALFVPEGLQFEYDFLKDKELYISKKTCYNVEDWIDRKKEIIERNEKMNMTGSHAGEEESKDQKDIEYPMELNPFVIRCALEAMHFAYGALVCP